MIKTHVLFLLVLMLWSIQGLNSPMYTRTSFSTSDQVILWGGASTIQTPNSVSTFNYPFPAGALYDNTYDRHLALSGIKAALSDTIDFSLALQPYASDAYANIDVSVGPINIYSLAVHVMFINATCDFLWIASGGILIIIEDHTFVDLADENGAVETEMFTVTTPSVLSTCCHYELYHFIRHLKIQTYVNSSTMLGIEVNYLSWSPPNSVSFTTTRTPLSSFQTVGLVVVISRRNRMRDNYVARYAFNHTETQSIPTTPFDITFPGFLLGSPFGGVQGECILGFHSFMFGGDRSITTSRSILFLQDTIPFTSVQKIIPIGEKFVGEWRGLCVMKCPAGSTYVSYNCVIPAPITNCQTQINSTHCAQCNSGYFLNSLGTSCPSCISNTGGSCATCDNQTICLTCVIPDFTLVNSSCLPCSDVISDCLLCTSPSTCTQCINDTFLEVAGTCEFCNISLQNCLRCSSSTVCIECDSTTALVGATCQPCSTAIPGCSVCNSVGCALCLSGYGLAANGPGFYCTLCSNHVSNCLQCYQAGPMVCLICSPPYVLVSGSCLSCSDAITNCSTCLSSTFCTSCLDQYTYLHYISNTSQLCFKCQIQLQYCLTCSSQTICTSCLNSSYYLNNSKCLTCGVTLHGCSECYPSGMDIKCSLCSSQVYFLNNTQQCQLCSLYIGNCSTCSNQTECLQCLDSSYIFFSNITSCLQCSDVFPYCQQCNEDRCTACPPGMHSFDGWMSCQCVLGQLVGGVCSQIIGCTNLMLDPQGQQICLFCNTDYFQPQPVNNLCLCLNGQLINGICSTISGCILPVLNSDGTQTCFFCNISQGFSGKPVNNTCVCADKFQNVNGTCMEICGDGYYMGSYQCDDGNLDDNDGCSSTCQVEVGYRCYNGSSQQPSTCVYEGIPVSIQLKRITRVAELNQGMFKFSLIPALVNINKMNLSQHVLLTCVDTVYQVSKVQYSISGELTLKVDFDTDMEGRQCNLMLSFDKSIIVSPNSTIEFSANSDTLKLVIITKQQQYKLIKLIFTYLGYAAVGIFLISLGYKMIGAELMTCFQLVYFSNAFYKKQLFFLSQTLGLNVVSGGWSLFYDDNYSQFMIPFTQRVEMTPCFLENNVVVVAVLAVSMALWLLLEAIHYCKATVSQEGGYKITLAQKQCFGKISFIAGLIYQTVLFPVVAGFTIVLLVSAQVDTSGAGKINNDSSLFPQTVNSSIMLVTMLVVSVVFAIEFIHIKVLVDRRQAEKRSLRGLKQAKPWYVKAFLARSLLFVLMIEVGITEGYDLLIYFLTLLEVAYFFLIIIARPYNRKIDNLGLIILEFTTLMSFAIPLAMNFFSIEQAMEVLITFILQGCLSCALFVTFLRLLLHYKGLIRKIISNNQLQHQIVVNIEQTYAGKAISQEVNQRNIGHKMRMEEHQQPIKMVTNSYSLYSNKQYQGKQRLLPRSKVQLQNRKAIIPSDSRVVFQDEEDEEVKVIKQKLRESLVQFRQKRYQ